MKQLIEKRAALLAEYDSFKKALETEKRAAYNAEEREKINKIKLDIEDLDAQIAIEKDMDAKRTAKLDNIGEPVTNINKRDYVTEFRNFMAAPGAGEKFVIPFTELSQRATITTSSNAQVNYTESNSPLSVVRPQLALDALGVKTYYFDSGAQDMPSMSHIVGTFGTEDNTVNDQTLTTAKVTLTPQFVSASLEVSKKWIASSKPENIQSLMAELKFAIDKAVEKRTIDSMNSLTPAQSGGTISFHSGTTIMEGALVGEPTGYIFSRVGIQAAKNKKIDSGSGRLVYDPSNSASQAGGINGYPAYRSALQSFTDAAYLIDASAVAKAYWSEGVSVEVITDATLARKGNVLLIASALADGSYLDANKVATAKKITSWT